MRLVDADIATDAISNMREEPEYKHVGEDWKIGLMHAEDILDEQPTVDAIPISWLEDLHKTAQSEEADRMIDEIISLWEARKNE